MSVTATERANPPPRRKSCAACTRAKRRCDLATPSCQRCVGRGLACHYPQRRGPPSPRDSLSLSATPELAPAVPDFSIDALMDDFWANEACAVDPLPLPEFAPAAEMPHGGSDASAGPVPPVPLNNDGIVIIKDDRRLVHLEHGHPDAFCTVDEIGCIPQFLSERLDYIFEYLPSTPKELVDTLGTPWCHPAAFKDVTPAVFDDLLSTCALYTSKNPKNKAIIMRILLARTRDLAASPAPSTPHDALARTLALIMYHIIALLDGDVEARATAESTLPALESAATSLLPHANLGAEPTYPATLPLYPLTETEPFWKTWVLTESIRRTMLFGHQFRVCYSLLRGATIIDCRAIARHQAWTLAAPLWHADNAVDFAIAWGDKNRWLMDVVKSEGSFDGADPEDICQFGRMFMTCFMGRQQARGWFAARGGKL